MSTETELITVPYINDKNKCNKQVVGTMSVVKFQTFAKPKVAASGNIIKLQKQINKIIPFSTSQEKFAENFPCK